MSNKNVISVQCPGCKGYLDIDVVREKVVGHKKHVGADDPTKDKDALFEDVVNRVKSRTAETEDKFLSAQRAVKESSKRLDDLFGEVKKKIAEEREKGPSANDEKQNPRFWD
jgi:hypothetical protein